MKYYEITQTDEFAFSAIYLWTNLIDGKHYVGQAQNVGVRFSLYRRGHFNPYMKRAIEKYGKDAFDITFVERDVPLERLNELEQYWMDYYNSYDRDFGYNICPVAGSCRGIKRSDEHRAKLSAAMKARQAEHSSFLGCKHTDATKLKMSENAKIRHRENEESYNHHPNTDEEKARTSEFFKEYWKTHTHPQTGKPHTEEYKALMREKSKDFNFNRRKRRVECWSMDGELVCCYDSVSDACRDIGKVDENGKVKAGAVSLICGVIKGRKKSAFGFIWKDKGIYHECDEQV